ncbi:MAG: hypothetical protein ACK2VD_22660 [Anaerolineae bacterium]
MLRSLFRLFVAVSCIASALCVLPAHAATRSHVGGSVHPDRAPLSSQALLFQDDFGDRNYTVAGGADGLTWSLIAGDASVDDVDGSFQLGVDRGISLIATNQRIAGDEYTLRFDGRITWGAPGGIVVLDKDANNYYSVGLGEQAGIYRKLNGSEVQLHTDPESLVRLPHRSAQTGAFGVYPHNAGSSIAIEADKAGDGVDYDIEIVDADPAAVATFTQTGIRMVSGGGEPCSPWFYIDNVAIYERLVVDSYAPVTYYVDQSHPLASDGNPGTESLP